MNIINIKNYSLKLKVLLVAITIIIVIGVLSYCNLVYAKNEVINFNGAKYVKVFNSEKPHFSLTEYLTSDQNLDNWTELMGKYVYKDVKVSAIDVALDFSQTLNAENPGSSKVLLLEGDKEGEAIVFGIIADEINPETGKVRYFEVNVFHYKKSGKNVHSLQYANRHHVKSKTDKGIMKEFKNFSEESQKEIEKIIEEMIELDPTKF